MKTKTEKIVAEINTSVFFREFTFSRNNFTELNSKQKLEFADNVVWLDDIFFIYQIKDRSDLNGSSSNWFENAVLTKAVRQIKSTLRYLNE